MKSKRTIKEIKYLLPRIRNLLEEIYGERLVDIILYGSFAKNNATEDSDIDIAVVLKGKINRTKEIDRMSEALYDLMLETDELFSVYPVSEDELNDSVWPLHYHIRTDGIRVGRFR